ncbi:MAG: hypothetical protein R3185_07595, partial [Candidatus Thermoplasmatota archaeon]|nr:hypothetical protein [Candidatus Thermoplasmatota archaeon]
MNVQVHRTTLPLHTPFTIARGTLDTLKVAHLRLEHEGVVGWGEGCPMPGVTGEDLPTILDQLKALDPEAIDPEDPRGTLDAHPHLGPGAGAALDLALTDLKGRLTNTPVHELLDLPEGMAPSAATITLTDPEQAEQQARS